jgi:chemotaxis response regulator CheB
MKVLIVDDSVLLRKRLVAALSEIECVEIAGEISDGLEAIDDTGYPIAQHQWH